MTDKERIAELEKEVERLNELVDELELEVEYAYDELECE